MCGTSTDCKRLCLWITPLSFCIMMAAMGFSMVGSCFFGWYFSMKAENDFLVWTCKVEEFWEWRHGEYGFSYYKAYPVGFSEDDDDYYEIEDISYLRRDTFMTKSDSYTEDNHLYVCNLYGYDEEDYSVDVGHTVVWDVDKMQRFFGRLVLCGLIVGLFSLFFILCFWRKDNRGEIMHVKVKQIFFLLVIATAMLITGLCGIIIDLFPYDGFAKVFGGIMLGISMIYPFYCMWATCKVAKDMGLRPGGGKRQRGHVYSVDNLEGEDVYDTYAVPGEGQRIPEGAKEQGETAEGEQTTGEGLRI